ncbi:hypothetical protein VTN00DRAFT_3755 [Thermoascus crustaceus]|uniref:uncharacterized protein n=1 Tax=Thermoascus crustaceus TaxID=5088 RepID=UPI0037423DEC
MEETVCPRARASTYAWARIRAEATSVYSIAAFLGALSWCQSTLCLGVKALLGFRKGNSPGPQFEDRGIHQRKNVGTMICPGIWRNNSDKQWTQSEAHDKFLIRVNVNLRIRSD